ncbi:MAG: response regulator [Candidatus Bathyarchaeota archaeon]|jgi:DNA-binding NtrC family response regulator
MDKSARLLIVDDDENIRKVLTAILEEEGYNVESASTGKKAIAKAQGTFYNLALIDIRLPDMEGIELLTGLPETTPRIRKLIITGYPTLQNAINAVNKGADAYIIKPFDVKKVLFQINEELKKQSKEEKYSQEKVAAFIETRVRELETQTTMTQKTKP